MKRKEFIYQSSLLAGGIALGIDPIRSTGMLKVKDLQQVLRSLVPVEEPSTDRIILGDPEANITGIGTCWMSHWELCKEAVSKGINVLITHEPTFYTHWDLDSKTDDYLNPKATATSEYVRQRDQKIKWLNDHGLSIIRCHDVMDKMQGIGMPFALGQTMGFTNDVIIRSRTYYNVYKIIPQMAISLAKMIAQKLKIAAHQPGVGFYGDGQRVVQSIGVGCGYICDPLEFADLKPDVYLVINDRIKTWIQGSYSMDSGQPMIVIDHGTSEEFGMRKLRDHLETLIPGHNIIHFPRGCTYQWITV